MHRKCRRSTSRRKRSSRLQLRVAELSTRIPYVALEDYRSVCYHDALVQIRFHVVVSEVRPLIPCWYRGVASMLTSSPTTYVLTSSRYQVWYYYCIRRR